MIPELGHFALIIALAMAIIQTIFPIVGASNNNHAWMSLARPVAQLQFLFVVLAFAILTYCFLANDFSVAYVANNSNSLLPTIYRFSAVWGAHEGSLLLWTLTLSLWTTAVTLYSKRLPIHFLARVIGVMGSVSVGFLLFMLLTSNPFDRLFPVPADGGDLNPLLQDPGLIIHPPMLYMGYVGFSVAFGFAIAALLGGNLDTSWARWSRPWTILAWMFLTIGIALGSWWAYYELGWGGWWFWDPVENASFMPWLIGTALIHSFAATEKRDVFKNWTILLAICAFALSLLGTFLVRSGVITSVHAFATDPTRGVFILILLGIFVGGSLLLYAWRAPSTMRSGQFKLFSRETFLLFNSVLLLVAMLTVLLGTIYPLFIEALGRGKLSVGAPYFNAVFIPLMSPVVVLIGVGAIVRWKHDEYKRVWKQLRTLLIASFIIGITLGLLFFDNHLFKTVAGLVAASWVILTSLSAFNARLKNRQNKLVALKTIPRGFYGMTIAHIGFAVCIVGITITSLHSVDIHQRMAPGDSIEFEGYKFTLEKLELVPGPNYRASQATVKVTRNNKDITTLRTQKRIYTVRNMPMTEAGIDSGFTRDLYVSLGEPLDENAWSIRLYHKPFVRWLWLGALFMALGGLLAATDRRYRIKPAAEKSAIIDGASATVK
jgi:cytochrome c-type biogenesis protein CcmF